MKKNSINPNLYNEVKRLGAKDMEACMQCGNCASACPLSAGENTFPRKIYRYLQLGLRDKLLESPEPWLCYYCGDCNTDCPRGAEPAETMMAARRWLITQYDWTGLAAKFYTSPKAEVGAFMAIALFVISLFVIFHGPIVTDRVELNTFAPVHWVHIGDQVMILIVFALLFANAAKMYFGIMQGTKVPLHLYLTQAPVFIVNYFTQKRWRKCGTGPGSAWWRHFFLFSGWVTMEVLVMITLSSFQTDIVHPFWHPTRIFGYYATVALMFGATTMLYSRWFKKEQKLHRYSDFTDLFFLVLIIAIAITGIMVHFLRIGGFPILTYTIYVIHVGICVGMLVLMLPFGKLSHLMYRPLAIFLCTIKEKAQKESEAKFATIRKDVGDIFQSCMQCGTCSAVCAGAEVADFNPRLVLRNISLDRGSNVSVDNAAWGCVTCNSCVEHCPRGIGILDLIKSVRRQVVASGLLPKSFETPISSLKKNGNPWGGKKENRLDWAKGANLPAYSNEQEYCLFTCCTTAYDNAVNKPGQKAGLALLSLMAHAGISYGTLGTKENCCGDMVDKVGAADVAADLTKKNTEMFQKAGVKKILTTSPHCLNSFIHDYPELKPAVAIEHAVELLDRLVASGQLKAVKAQNLSVTYHDPCYLGRHNSLYDAPRRVLGAIPGLRLIEMQNSKDRSLCCGGGAGGSWKEGIKGLSLSEIRVKEAMDTGASIIATACPYCIRTLNEAIVKLAVGNTIKVQDISELLLQSVDLSDTSGKPGINNMSFSQEGRHV